MPIEEAGTTLREQLSEALDSHESNDVAVETPVVETPTLETPAVPEVPEKPGRTAGRARDEHGKLLPGPAVRPEPETPAPRPARPSSWKKEMWDHWEKLDPNVAAYINQREQEAARGVSTYKQEWDQAKPLLDAIAPFQPLLQQHNIQPDAWIRNLGTAHQKLALGTPQEKLQMFAKLAQDYGVSLQSLGVEQGTADQLHYMSPVFERINQLEGRLQTWQSQQEQQAQASIQTEIQKFAATHPHYETVRSTMAGLLQSNVAQDLDSAYEKAIRLHDDIWQQEQESKAQAEAAKKLEQTKQAVSKAKANATSPRSATPSGNTTQAKGAKGLRDSLEEAFDEASSRV